jgi:serine protease Do
MQEVPPGLDRQLGVEETGGVIVKDVSPRSPAEQAGIRKGDLIIRYNKEPVGTVNPAAQLRQRVARTAPDTTVPVDIVRDLERITVEVTIIRRPAKL